MIGHFMARWWSAAAFAALLSPPAAQQNAVRPPRAAPDQAQALSALQSAPIPEPLRVDEAVRIGVGRSPQIAAAVAGVASAVASYRSLDAFPDPQLGVTRAQGTSTAPTLNGTSSDTFIDVGEVLDTSGQRRFQAAGARAQAGATRYQAAETLLTLEQQIRDAYWSLAAARGLTQYARESLQEAQHVNQLVRTQQAAGASPQVDVIRSTIDVANAQQAAVTAQGAERAALSALNVLLVRPPYQPLALASELGAGVDPKAAVAYLPDLASLTKTAIAGRPLVKAATELVRVAEYAIKQARATRLPDLSVDYERSLQQTSDTVLLALRLPLFDLGSTRYSVSAANETRKQAVAQRQQAEQQVQQQVAQAFQDTEQAQALLASYLTDVLNPSVSLRDMAQLGYQQGATGILTVIDAEATLRTARTGYVNSLLAVHKAADELTAAAGAPVPH